MGRHRRRNRPAAQRPGNDRLGELYQPRRHAGRGQRVDQQICRGLSRPSILRRLRIRRCGRGTGPRAGSSRSSGPSMPTSSRTPAPRPTRRSICRRLQPGDTVLGLDLAHGGHLTHGMKLNISGKLYHFFSYGVRADTHRIDFDQVAALAREHKPKMIVAGASAYPREIPHGKFAEISREVRGETVRRHGPLCRAGGGQAARRSRAGGRLRFLDHAQNAPRPARRDDSLQAGLRQRDRSGRVSGHARRAADARHRRQGGLLRRSARRPASSSMSSRSSTMPRPWPTCFWPAA